MARSSERSELRFLTSQRVPNSRRPGGADRDVGVDPQRPLLHPAVGSPRRHEDRRAARRRRRGPGPPCGCPGWRRSPPAGRRRGCSRPASGRRAWMRPPPPTWVVLPVSSSMWARFDADAEPVGQLEAASDIERHVVLADLVVLRHVRVEVVLAVEIERRDLAVQRIADPHGELDGLFVEDGSEPGSPRQTGQTLVLGASPNALRHPQKSFVAVASSQCTSSPTTVSSVTALTSPRLRGVRLLQARATRNSIASPRAGAMTCTPTGSPSSPAPNGTVPPGARPGSTGWCRHRSCTSPSGRRPWRPGRRPSWGRGAEQHVQRFVGPVECLHDERARPLGLPVVGVVVAGGRARRSRASRGASPRDRTRPCGWPCSSRRRPLRRPAGRSGPRRSGRGWRRPRPARSGSRRTARSANSGTEISSTLAPAPASASAASAPRRPLGCASVHEVAARARPGCPAPVVHRARAGSGPKGARCCRADRARRSRRRAARHPPPSWRTGRSGRANWRRPPARNGRHGRRWASFRRRRTARRADGSIRPCRTRVRVG